MRKLPIVTLLVLGAGASCRAAPTVKATTAAVAFAVSKTAEVHVQVELALTGAERQQGLMNRRSLAGGAGMLFVFPEPDVHKFWMHNTYISLDMIFLDAKKNVVSVEERAEPLTDTPRGPDDRTQYVVEVPGGWARSHGIEPGVSAKFSGVPDGAH